MTVLTVSNVSRSFGDLQIFSRVSFVARSGEIVVISGENGAGKSTLLNGVAAIDRFSEGEVLLNGHAMVDTDVPTRRALSFVLDSSQLEPTLTAIDHLRLVSALHSCAARETELLEILERLDVAAVAARLPSGMSSGQRQRVKLAVAACRPFDILVLDEPERHLDAFGHELVRDLIVQQSSAGRIVLLASHSAEMRALGTVVVDLG